MNANEALEVLRAGKTVRSNHWHGWFRLIGDDTVYFDCGGGEDGIECCQYDESIEDFLYDHRNEIFEEEK